LTIEIQVRDLPPFPTVIVDLLTAVDDSRVGQTTISKMLRMEPTLSASVLRLANAAWYGRQPVSDLDAALARIGMGRVAELVTASWMAGVIPPMIPFYQETSEDLWRHSVATAVVAQQLAPKHKVSPQTAFMAGLLHDLGKVAIAINPGSTPQPLEVKDDQRPVDAERALLGRSHDEVGGALAASWRLPADLVEAIRFHHEPHLATTQSRKMLATLVGFGSSVARYFGYGSDVGGLRRSLASETYPLFGLSSEELQVVVLESLDPITALQQAFPTRPAAVRPAS
jgi:putative nucleotidyltransferase with HDIG domain